MLSAVVSAIVLTVAVIRIPDVSAAETMEARYRRAISGLDQFRNNMNGHWFGFTSEHRYVVDTSPRARERYGVIFYSESLIYIAYLEFPDSPDRPRWLAQQTEAIISDRWVISTNHLFPPQTVTISEEKSPQFRTDESACRILSDVTLLFQQRIVDFAIQDFAKPHINANGQLVVRCSSGQAVSNAGSPAAPGNRVFEVVFSGEPDIRPASNKMLKLSANGETQELGFVDVRYGQTSAGNTVVRRIVSEARRDTSDEIPEVYDIRIREIECPGWNTTPPRISRTSELLAVRQHDAGGRLLPDTDRLPADVEEMFHQIQRSEFKQQIVNQKKTLESMDAFVRAEVVSPEPAPAVDAASQQAITFPLANVVTTVLGAVVIVLVGIWTVLWKRAYSRRR